MLWYTCYDPDTDEILTLGPPQNCARSLGISVTTFYSYVSNAKLGYFSPYTFVIENLKTGRMITLHGSKYGEKCRIRKHGHRRRVGKRIV